MDTRFTSSSPTERNWNSLALVILNLTIMMMMMKTKEYLPVNQSDLWEEISLLVELGYHSIESNL